VLQVLHGLSVVNTRNLDDTAAFLRRMHTRISHNLASFVKAMREDALYENTQ
jgi:ERCC4-type nuclease